MPDKLTPTEKRYFVDDGADRGPMTMFRVRFHPGEAKLWAQCVDRRLALWDLNAEPQEVKRKKEKYIVGELVCPHEVGWIRGFDVHPGGQHVVTGGSDRTLRLWNWQDGRPAEKPLASVKAHDGWVEAVAYSPDGSQLVTVGADALLKIWEAETLKLVESLVGHKKYACDVAFSPDGKLLLSGAEDGWVIVRDAKSHDELRRIEFGSANEQFGQNPRHSGVHRLSVSHDNRWLAAAGGENLNVYDLASGEIVAAEKLRMDVAFHPSADVLAGGDNQTKVWRYEANRLAPPEQDKKGNRKSPSGLPGKELSTIKRGDWSLGLRFSPDGQRLALGKSDGTVEMWELG